jgi:class 3 adenylate cyclase
MDVVGYSRLIGLDDAGTLSRLRFLRNTVIEPAINEHGGKIVQTAGDSFLIIFDSIDGAVRFGVQVQRQVPLYDADKPSDQTIRFRIGISLGDAIADGTDVHGDAVNIAARLQSECPVGGICVSRSIREHVHDRLGLSFEELGLLTLKNIARPVEAFLLKFDAATDKGFETGLHAFLEGAGVFGELSRDDAEGALREFGGLVRILVEGLRELLISRAAIKAELRVEQTMIRSASNNPLKFSVTTDQAVIAVLTAPRAGYMDPLVAVQEAFQDVKMHELAMIAGMRAALTALLQRFNPEVLEKRLEQGVLATLLPAARRARLWNEFRALYGAIAAEAEDDFHSVFGRAFVRAYNEQTATSESSGRAKPMD